MSEESRASSAAGSKNPISEPKLPDINPYVILELEREAHQLSKEFYKLSKQLQTKLNQISAASVCCMQTLNESVNKTCDSLDECTKENGILLQKANELSKSMEPVYKLQVKINSIKTILSALETQI